ncbi:MAG: DinB family protein [Anaerolineae bacterium]|jgi:uncharacterized protein (TIGR03083 family)|nr:DinB family protein [Anaerolineae bacterium]
MSERIKNIRHKLIESADFVNTVLDQVGEQTDVQVYSDGLGWTVRQLVVHLSEAYRGMNNQAINISEGRDLIPPDFDIERYNKRQTEKNADKTFEQARGELQTAREQLLTWLDSLDDEKLDHKGRHASLRVMSVEEILLLQALHEKGHAADIAHALNLHLQ